MIAILMSVLMILLFSGLVRIPLDKDVTSSVAGAKQLSGFVDMVDYSVSVALHQATFDILEAMVVYHGGSNFFVDANRSFLDCFVTGTFDPDDDGTYQPCSVENISFTNNLDELTNLSDAAFDANMTFAVKEVSFAQSSTYAVGVDAVVLVSIEKGDYSWDKLVSLSEEISIVGVTDPLLLRIGVSRPIQFRPGEFGQLIRVDFFRNNFTMLDEFIDNGYYYRDNSSHSFIDMLQGDIPANESEYRPYGVGSFIPEPSSNYLDNNTALVEYQYFGQIHYGVPTYGEGDLRRIDGFSISDDFLLSASYLEDKMDGDPTTPSLLDVQGCCFNPPLRCQYPCG